MNLSTVPTQNLLNALLNKTVQVKKLVLQKTQMVDAFSKHLTLSELLSHTNRH